eukprot:Gb_09585 [translate_table: standard]
MTKMTINACVQTLEGITQPLANLKNNEGNHNNQTLDLVMSFMNIKNAQQIQEPKGELRINTTKEANILVASTQGGQVEGMVIYSSGLEDIQAERANKNQAHQSHPMHIEPRMLNFTQSLRKVEKVQDNERNKNRQVWKEHTLKGPLLLLDCAFVNNLSATIRSSRSFKDQKENRDNLEQIRLAINIVETLMEKCDPVREEHLCLYAQLDGMWQLEEPSKQIPANQYDAWITYIAFFYGDESSFNPKHRGVLFYKVSRLEPMSRAVEVYYILNRIPEGLHSTPKLTGLYPAHHGSFSSRDTFCLLEVLNKEEAIQPILDILQEHKTEVLGQQAVWTMGKILECQVISAPQSTSIQSVRSTQEYHCLLRSPTYSNRLDKQPIVAFVPIDLTSYNKM